MFDLETNIRSWTDYLRSHGSLNEEDVKELETHLREELDALQDRGLSGDEAFLVAVKRLGQADVLAREFAKVNTERMWKQLMVDPVDERSRILKHRELALIIGLSFCAGLLSKLPELFGLHLFRGDEIFYLRNGSLFIFPFMSVYFLWKFKDLSLRSWICLGAFILSGLLINIPPFNRTGQTDLLTAIHLPILLWLPVALIYSGRRWSETEGPMDVVRFSGETFIYSVLLLCGGFVLVAITEIIFQSIEVNTNAVVMEYVAVFGGLAAPIVAAYLVEAKRSIVENLAPVLARIFSPLFLVLMLSFLGVMIALGKSPFMERDFLIGFDILLALVLGIVVYILSARDKLRGPNIFDYLNIALIVFALIIDLVALSAIVFRIGSFGITANKTAALGENLVLLVGLAGLVVPYIRFVFRRGEFEVLLRWQIRYLPVFAIWAGLVVFLFPLIFR